MREKGRERFDKEDERRGRAEKERRRDIPNHESSYQNQAINTRLDYLYSWKRGCWAGEEWKVKMWLRRKSSYILLSCFHCTCAGGLQLFKMRDCVLPAKGSISDWLLQIFVDFICFTFCLSENCRDFSFGEGLVKTHLEQSNGYALYTFPLFKVWKRITDSVSPHL